MAIGTDDADLLTRLYEARGVVEEDLLPESFSDTLDLKHVISCFGYPTASSAKGVSYPQAERRNI